MCWIRCLASDTVYIYSDCMEKKRCNVSIITRWKKDLQNEYTRRCAWTQEEVEQWLDKRKAESPEVYTGKKPPVELRKYRPVSAAA